MHWPFKINQIAPSYRRAGQLWRYIFNTLRPRLNGRCFADGTFKRIFLNENVRISIKIALKFVPKGPINNVPALVQIMAWHWSGDKPLSEPMMVSLLTHIFVARPQWVNHMTKAWIRDYNHLQLRHMITHGSLSAVVMITAFGVSEWMST